MENTDKDISKVDEKLMGGKKMKIQSKDKRMKIQAKNEKIELLNFEKKINQMYVEMTQAQFSIDKMLDYISCNGGLEVKDPNSIHSLVAQLIALPQILEKEFQPKSRVDYSKLKIEGAKRVAEIMENFVETQYVNVDWEYFNDEEKKDILKQILIDWAVSYIINALEIRRRENFSNTIGKGGMN